MEYGGRTLAAAYASAEPYEVPSSAPAEPRVVACVSGPGYGSGPPIAGSTTPSFDHEEEAEHPLAASTAGRRRGRRMGAAVLAGRTAVSAIEARQEHLGTSLLAEGTDTPITLALSPQSVKTDSQAGEGDARPSE